MAKIKVHELAKELEKQSKEIVAFLQDKGIEGKAPASALEDDVAEMVRKHFTKAESSVPKAESEEAKAEAPKKKKKIIFVSNPNNSKMPTSQRPPASSAMKQAAKPAVKPAAKPAPKAEEAETKKTDVKPTEVKEAVKSQEEMKPAETQTVEVKTIETKKTETKQEEVKNSVKPEAEAVETKKTVEETPAVNKTVETKKEEAASTQEKKEQTMKEEKTVTMDKQPENRTNYQNKNNTNNNGRSGHQDRENGGNRGGYQQDRNNGGNRNGYHDRNGNNRGNYQDRNGNGGRTQNTDRNGSGAKPGYNGGQGNRPNNGGNQNNNRPFGNNDRDKRGNGGQDNKFRKPSPSKSFMPEAPIKDAEKHRDEEKRRISQEKDKRSKKDLIYEEDDNKIKNKAGRFIKPEKKVEVVEEQIKVITIPDSLTIKELADKMKMQPSAIIKKLFMQGQIVTVNSEISFEDAENIAIDYEIICEKEEKVDVIEELLKEEDEAEETMVSRPPVICVMGHVDHGKTSLLDAIRKTNVTDREAGGITQHIGAYTVTANGQQITFLDTPGHEAFTAMRMRGANSTDIAILVVAADDGVMPQTVEAINHAKAAGIEIIVAVNKIDKPSANLDRVKQEMTEHELIPVDWGGSTEFVPVSAKSGEGIDTLLETILLTAEIMELKANPNRKARGLVIEAELDKGRGPVATVLVQKGTLHVGDFVSAGASHGKVRAMIDDKGRRVKEAGPSMPVEILGLSDVPSAGEVIIAHENDKTAKSFAETYLAQNKEKMLEETKTKMSLDDLFTQIQAGNLKELNLIIKADVQGSVEAVKQSLLKLSNEEVVVKCIHGGVGAINESDVSLASASSAIIIGFNVRPDATAKTIAEREGVDVRLYRVIYQAIEDVEAAMKGMLDPVFEEKIIGHAEVRQIFKASAVGNIAGSYVLDGIFERNCKVRITREGEQIFEGELASLKRFKDDVKEVKAGFECGLVFEGFDQMQELDIVEAYKMVEVPR
ncbi:MAG: translation initiation factor IF-2 [Lachnospiraceae bacterium]|nr:translation initiation factor IF-2 [Lachnospiraceae bacterium]